MYERDLVLTARYARKHWLWVCRNSKLFHMYLYREGRTGSALRSKLRMHHLRLSLTAAGFFSIRSAQVCYSSSSSSSSSCSTTAHNRSNKAGAQGEIMMHDRVGPFISVFYNGCRVEVIKLQHHYNERAPLIETRWGSGGLCRNCTSQLCHWGGGFN